MILSSNSGFDDPTVLQGSAATSEETPKARLICLDDLLEDSLKGLEIQLVDSEQTIGRGPQNTVSLLYKKISRQHARIYPKNGVWEIEDLHSANGVFVNEERVTRSRLGHGDIVRLGPIPFRYQLERPATVQEAPSVSSAHLGEGGTMYAHHPGVLESLLAAKEADAAETPASPAPSVAAPAGGRGTQTKRPLLRYGLLLLLAVVLFGGGYLYLRYQHEREGEALAKGLATRLQTFLEHSEGEAEPLPQQTRERELGEIRTLAAHVSVATVEHPDNGALRALQARLAFLQFEREFAKLLAEGEVYDAEQLVRETQQMVSSLARGKGPLGQEAIEEVSNLLDLAALTVRFRQFRKRFPDPTNPGSVQPNPYELQAVKALNRPFIDKKRAVHVALSITYLRFQQLLAGVEEEDMRLVNRWQEVLGRRLDE